MVCDVTIPAHESWNDSVNEGNLSRSFLSSAQSGKVSAVFRTLRPKGLMSVKMLKTMGLTGTTLTEASSLMLSCVSLLQLPNLSGFLTDESGAYFPKSHSFEQRPVACLWCGCRQSLVCTHRCSSGPWDSLLPLLQKQTPGPLSS